MADLLNVAQGTISKFESTALKVRLDFLISYAGVLGYQIIVSNISRGELTRFRERQAQISKELSTLKHSRIDAALKLPLQGNAVSNSFIAEEKVHIMSKLREAKSIRADIAYVRICAERLITNLKNISYIATAAHIEKQHIYVMSKVIGVSKRMIRRFERDESYMSTADFVFRYISYMGRELQLAERFQVPEETVGKFYIRNCLALHSAAGNSADAVKRVHKAIKTLTPDKYAEFVFVLRNIRESYQISQEEMARLMNTKQCVISKFESVNPHTKLDFLLSYAILLGYNVRIVDPSKDADEVSRFNERQSEIAKMIS